MSGILRLESLTKGNTLKQGDKTPLKYRLFDADGDELNISGKSAKVRLVYPGFLTIGYEKDGLTVAQDDTVTFTIDNVIPARIYHVEIIVDDKFIFPSRADESKFTVDKSSLGTEANIIEVVGVDAVVKKAVGLINEDPSLIIDEDKLVSDIINNTGIGSIEEYHQQFNNVIKELSEEKDYHSLPEIAGARGGFDTLGERLNDTTAQLAHKVGLGKKAELEDLSPTVLSAIDGGEGAEFNLLSIPQDRSVTPEKTTFVKSKNLFNGKYSRGVNLAGGTPENVIYSTNSPNSISAEMFIPSGTYTISKSEDTDSFWIMTFADKPVHGSKPMSVFNMPGVTMDNPRTIEITIDSYLVVRLSSNSEGKVPSWFQVEKGTEASNPFAVDLTLGEETMEDIKNRTGNVLTSFMTTNNEEWVI